MRTGRVVMAVPPGQGFVRGARTATGAGALGRDGLESPAGRSTLRSVHPAGRVGMMNLLATKKVRAIEVVTARGAERGEGQAEQRPVMSGAGRGPTFPGAGHQVTSLQATQLVADRKDFRGQREPTEAIIGNGHGHGCQLWTQQHRSHQSAVNVAGGAPVATAVNSSRSAVADDDLVLARRGVGSLADFEFGVFGVCETCPGCSDAVVAAARPGCSTRLLDPAARPGWWRAWSIRARLLPAGGLDLDVLGAHRGQLRGRHRAGQVDGQRDHSDPGQRWRGRGAHGVRIRK